MGLCSKKIFTQPFKIVTLSPIFCFMTMKIYGNIYGVPMLKAIKYLLGVFSAAFMLSACTLTPQDKLVGDLAAKLTHIDTPSNINVVNNHLSDTISVTWDPVENASYYTVEYQKVSDYLENKSPLELIAHTNSVDIRVPEGSDVSSKRDKRYIFRIKATYVERDAAGNVTNTIDSSYSRHFEGVIADYLTVTYIKQDNTLTVFDTASKVASILEDRQLASLDVRYFDEPYYPGMTSVDSADEIESINGFHLESGQTYSFTAALYADGVLTALTGIEASADVVYDPPAVPDLAAENNLRDCIRITWSPVHAAGGVDASVFYAVERKTSQSDDWQYVMNEEGDAILLLEDCVFEDYTAAANESYDYRILSVYVLDSDGTMIVQNSKEALSAENCHRLDTKPASFTAEIINADIAEDGLYKAEVKLEWTAFHEDICSAGDSFSYRIKRHLSGSQDAEVFSIPASTLTFTDTIALEASQHPSDLTYYYTIEYVYDNTALESEISAAGSDGLPFFHTVPGTLEKVEYVKSFSATGMDDGKPPYADKVRLEWSLNDISVLPDGEHSIDNIRLSLSRREITSVEATVIKTFDSPQSMEGSYDDASAEPGVEYEYLLSAQYISSGDIHDGQTHTLSSHGIRLDAPENFTASMNTSSTSIDLSWDPVEGAAGYRVMFREAGSGDENMLLETYAPDVSSASVPADGGMIKAGHVYEFIIQSFDGYSEGEEERRYSVPGPVARGCMLGCLPLNVENGEDYIRISWDEAENVNMYVILIFDEEGNEIYRTQASHGVTSYMLEADDLPQKIMEMEYPLSTEYSFAVIPGNLEISEYVLTEGSWIMPPRNIMASKADYRDIIEISWESAGDDYSYVVYRKEHGSDSAWSFVEYTSGTSYSYLTTTEEYDFSVASVRNGIQGPVQTYFEKDSNYGYPLMKPARAGASDYGNDLFQIYFSQVKGATSYKVDIEGNVYTVTDSQIAEAPQSVSGYSDGTVTVDSSGMVWLYVAKISPERKLTWDVFISAVNDNAAYDDKNSTEPVSLTKLYNENSLTDADYINVIFNNLHDIVVTINNYYGGDWWPTSREYYDGGNITSSSCSGISSAFPWNTPSSDGNIIFTDAKINEITFAGSLNCYIDANSAHLTSKDPLRRISGELVVVLPYNYPSFSISFSEHPVTSTDSGQLTITKNGSVISGVTSVPSLL